MEVFGATTFPNNADAVSSTAAPTANLHIDETRLCGGVHFDKWRRMKGIFVAAWDGKFQFQIQATPGGAVKAEGVGLRLPGIEPNMIFIIAIEAYIFVMLAIETYIIFKGQFKRQVANAKYVVSFTQ